MGTNENGQKYFGTAEIEVLENEIKLVSQIGKNKLEYNGEVRGNKLVFVGPHSVCYEYDDPDGVLIGTWNDSGNESLIPCLKQKKT